MKKEDLKHWTRDRLETEILNLSDKNFHLELRIGDYEEIEGRYKSENECLRKEISEVSNRALKAEEENSRLLEKLNEYEKNAIHASEHTKTEFVCCGCREESVLPFEDEFDVEELIIEQQIEIEKLNATIDVLIERIV